VRKASHLTMLAIAIVCVFGVFAVSAYTSPTSTTPPTGDDAVAPTTTSDINDSYIGDATIDLTAADNDGGWGVAYIYYKLDHGYTHLFTVGTTAETSVTVKAPAIGSAASATHKISFWSQDKFGNVEQRTTKTFTVNAAKFVTALTLKRSASRVRALQPFTLSGVIRPGAVCKVAAQRRKPGTRTWKTHWVRTTAGSGAYSCRYRTGVKGTWSFRTRFTESPSSLGSVSPIVRVRVK